MQPNENENKINYTRLEKEIKNEQLKFRLENYKYSQEPKKSLKNKLLAWTLGGVIVAGAAIGLGYGMRDKIDDIISNLPTNSFLGDDIFLDDYNKSVKEKFEEVNKTLTSAMKPTTYPHLENSEITGIYFEEPEKSDVTIRIFYDGDIDSDFGTERWSQYSDFCSPIKYYNELVEAEESRDMLKYLESLDEVFDNMYLIESCDRISNVKLELPEKTDDYAKLFNQLYNLDNIQNEDVVRQVGFLPYYCLLEEKHYENDPEQKTYYTYKIYGISYCETKSENFDYVKKSDKLIMEEKYDKNHIKAYNRVFTYSSYDYCEDINDSYKLTGDLYRLMDQGSFEYTLQEKYFSEANLSSYFFQMQKGNFNFEQPEDSMEK